MSQLSHDNDDVKSIDNTSGFLRKQSQLKNDRKMVKTDKQVNVFNWRPQSR